MFEGEGIPHGPEMDKPTPKVPEATTPDTGHELPDQEDTETKPNNNEATAEKQAVERKILQILQDNSGDARIGSAESYITVTDSAGNLVGTAHGLYGSTETGATAFHRLQAQLRNEVPEIRGKEKYFINLLSIRTHQSIMAQDI